MHSFVVRNVVHDRAMRGEVFNGQCHSGMAVLRVRAVSRKAGVVPTQSFVTVRSYPGVVLPGPRGGGGGEWRSRRGQPRWPPSSGVAALSYTTWEIAFSHNVVQSTIAQCALGDYVLQ